MLKKTIITSGAFMLAGALIISSVSADSNGADTKPTPTPTPYQDMMRKPDTNGADTKPTPTPTPYQDMMRKPDTNGADTKPTPTPTPYQDMMRKPDTNGADTKPTPTPTPYQDMMRKQEGIKEKQDVKKASLSEKLHSQLAVAIEKLTIDKLTRVLKNIDKALTKVEASSINQTRKDSLLAQLEEIRSTIQKKVDTITGTPSVDRILSEVLSDTVTTGPSTDTATGFIYNDATTKPMEHTID